MVVAQNRYHKSHPDLNRDLTMDSGAETRRVAQNVRTEREREKKKVFGFQGERPQTALSSKTARV